MNGLDEFSNISSLLSEWYKRNKRDLPWRINLDPYCIWLSEIILQQTKVEQGLPYYESILNRFPTVKALAEAPTDDVLKLWQGLGYYSRARNLHTAAKQVVQEFNGEFPASYDKLLQLKGVGEYTAAAISSIAFQLPFAVVDGNVFRVLARIFNIDLPINSTEGKKYFKQLAQDLLDRKHPDIHNQAMMEFGALQCTPTKPNCATCPVLEFCQAYWMKRIPVLPVKLAGAKKQERFFHYFYLTDGVYTWIHQRKNADIWQELWEFPLIESDKQETIENLIASKEVSSWIGNQAHIGSPVYLKHILSHRLIHAVFLPIQIEKNRSLPDTFMKIKLSEIDLFAVSKLTDKFISKNLLLNI